ncbi:bifunctional 3,4-dihydroxy-2-butanone-4-phosphate synthase/GTP cyclohydrolase II [Subtercola boreus]|uniref:GTP cyclohydrolase-2 n=1 Tax=Subtercola boreus TaxID=120213 RepID=A0A3E0VEN9_9MICO|nr:GTP cyclohydrolase II [Subtercola boreus]RFA08382.1 bifunctional 3,4-dihydroxy-2-butanone-4-phosphate synthase/GTP cyclohydrolase II [Subtercola boreus]TQL54710.1 3,4-dihydroxy 2-butanone 4-phosphate synthase/GTP cyclohydrolase II [Subtercola boreus]
MTLSSMPEVLAALRAGRPVIVADDEDRENEGDAILSAELASPEWIAWMVRHTSGFLCAPMTVARAAELGLPPMVEQNQDARRTAYTITVDASSGVTTGISAHDRAHTLRALADGAATPASFIRPGHVLPVVAVDGGVRQRPGHTEASVELLRLAGLVPVGVIGEIVSADGSMARMPELLQLGEDEDLPVTTIAALIEWLDAIGPAPVAATGARVTFEVETVVPTIHGSFRFRAYHDAETKTDHLAILSGDPHAEGALVRVHSECLTGEAFGSLKCECGPQLDAALDLIAERGGAVIYLRGHEGRGIGLLNKLRAYRLQEDGLDTLDANTVQGLPADGREYGAAAAILADLGLDRIRLLTNNPDKVHQLEDLGIVVAERQPLVVGRGGANSAYLDTKRDRMGHLLPS